MKKTLIFLFIVMAIGLAYIAFSDYSHSNNIIYFGGDIITMNEKQAIAEAVYVKDGKIIAVGSKEEILKLKTNNTQLIDLKGKILMPGLIDPHSHLDLAALFKSMTDVSGVNYRDINVVWSMIRNAVNKAKKDEWVYIYGFDPILTIGAKSPTLAQLDSLAPDKPLVIITKALHVFYANSKAFSNLGITNKTPDPSKASYYERDSTGNLTGAIVEQEALEPIRLKMQESIAGEFAQNTQILLQEYAKLGITSTVNMGVTATKKTIFSLYEHLAAQKSKPLYQLLAFFGKLPKRQANPRIFLYLRKESIDLLPEKSTNTDDFYKIIGVKLWYDGSPYSGSMFLRNAYIRSNFTINDINLSPNHTSHSLLTEAELEKWIETVQAKGYPIAIHAQGDIANNEVIDVFKKVHAKSPVTPFRHRIEHCMLLPKERLAEIKSMNMSLSFHINHLLYYGNFLSKEILGETRANQIFPIQSTAALQIPYSLHSDSPQFSPNPLGLASTSVNRKTEDGNIINANERVSVQQALKSITIDAAWQLHIEDKLGSIETGKYADLVILDKNPLKITPETLASIQVLETIVAGNVVWKR